MRRRFFREIVAAAALAVVGLGVAPIQAVAVGADDEPAPLPVPATAPPATPVDLPPELTGGDARHSNANPPDLPAPMPAPALPPAEAVEPPSDLPLRDPAVEPAQAPAATPAPAQTKQAPKPAKPPANVPKVAQAPARAAAAAAPSLPSLPPGEALPAAADPPGQPANANAGAGAVETAGPDDDRRFVLTPDRLPLGRQSIGLTVDVVAPPALNLNQLAHLKIIVRNAGQADALGVVVRDELPRTVKFLSSQPEAREIAGILSWPIGTIPAGAEKVITLTVKPIEVGSFDHAATVTMLAGGKSRTQVREPRLKVEQKAVTAKVLRGQPVQFQIAISNPGTGPARNVLVQAKLSRGLKHESGDPNENVFEQNIDLINPGERISLDTLVADSLEPGEQSCTIVAKSPDVVDGAPEARSLQTVTVVEPELKVALQGPDKRFTDMLAPYELTIKNTGTAPAKNVRISVNLPISGRLYQVPSGAKFDPQTRRLSWVRPQVDADETVALTFQVRIGLLLGPYKVVAEARADGGVQGQDDCQTIVEGLADVNCTVSERRRVVDINGETVYIIRIDNAGTKEATAVQVRAQLSPNILPVMTSGTDRDGAQLNKETNEVVFPEIERIPAGKAIELGIKVRAVKPGVASCRVFLSHQDMKDKIDSVARFTVSEFEASPTRR